jgi:xanthine dehydrogenase accessory factor
MPEDTMSHTLLELAYELTQAEKPFVIATVVWCERPTSAKPGAQAIIEADGRVTGWIGGSCTQPVVVREAVRALREGDEPYLLRLGASSVGVARSDVRSFPMACASGGALDVYIEPHLPRPQLVLIGDSPIIDALCRFGSVLDFAITRLDHADVNQMTVDTRASIIIATHGQYDEDALEPALRSPATYVGLVASRRRADACRAYLRTSGVEEQQIARLHAPAGLDIGAKTPEEIAASIIAELVQVRRRPVSRHDDSLPRVVQKQELLPKTASGSDTALDPVCGMMVEIANARHRSMYDGREFYFCCPACKRLFEGNPQEYLVQNGR